VKTAFYYLLIAIVVAGLFASCSNSSEPQEVPDFTADETERIDNIIDSVMTADNLPGAIVGVWIHDEGEYVESFGMANIETERRMGISDLFRIGSVTKTFVAEALIYSPTKAR
jgi:CubicO group peptidase (beta-lactamase class C family)